MAVNRRRGFRADRRAKLLFRQESEGSPSEADSQYLICASMVASAVVFLTLAISVNWILDAAMCILLGRTDRLYGTAIRGRQERL
jgi:hypothetical protein